MQPVRPFQDCTERPAMAVVGSNGLMLTFWAFKTHVAQSCK